MSLMVWARLKAVAHWWRHFLRWPPEFHHICRVYRFYGIDTLAVFCDCGVIFGNRSQYPIKEWFRPDLPRRHRPVTAKELRQR